MLGVRGGERRCKPIRMRDVMLYPNTPGLWGPMWSLGTWGQQGMVQPGRNASPTPRKPGVQDAKLSLLQHIGRIKDPRITECLGLEGTSVGHPAQPSCQSRVTQSRLHRTASRRSLNISREGDSTTSLGSLSQGSITLTVKFFLVFSWNFLCFSLCPLPLVLSLGTTEKSLAPSS